MTLAQDDVINELQNQKKDYLLNTVLPQQNPR